MKNKINTCLWYEKNLPEIVDYYKSIFQDNLVVNYMGDLEHGPGGEYQYAIIEIFGTRYDLLAAGPAFKLSEAVSLTINTKDQKETDFYWEALTANGGEESYCGWCKDKYGLSWQVVPKILTELSTSDNKKERDHAMQAMFKMKKIIINDLVK